MIVCMQSLIATYVFLHSYSKRLIIFAPPDIQDLLQQLHVLSAVIASASKQKKLRTVNVKNETGRRCFVDMMIGRNGSSSNRCLLGCWPLRKRKEGSMDGWMEEGMQEWRRGGKKEAGEEEWIEGRKGRMDGCKERIKVGIIDEGNEGRHVGWMKRWKKRWRDEWRKKLRKKGRKSDGRKEVKIDQWREERRKEGK